MLRGHDRTWSDEYRSIGVEGRKYGRGRKRQHAAATEEEESKSRKRLVVACVVSLSSCEVRAAESELSSRTAINLWTQVVLGENKLMFANRSSMRFDLLKP